MKKSLKVVCVAVIILFWAINVETPFLGDDTLYQFFYPNIPMEGVPHGVDRNRPISNLLDVITSQLNHYHNINGRLIVHTFVQIFCGLLPKWVFNLVNTIFFVLFLIVLGKWCKNDKYSDATIAFVPFALCYLFMVHPHVYYGGVAGGINYLWSSVACLLYWYVYTSSFSKSWKSINPILLFILSFVAGWSMEAIVIPLGIAVFVYSAINRKYITKLHLSSFFIFSIGAMFLVFAPGNFVRKSHSEGISLGAIIEFCKCLRLIYPLTLLIIYSYIRHRSSFVTWIKNSTNLALLFSLYFVSIVLGIFIGPAAPRVGYGIELISALLITTLLIQLFDKGKIKIGVICSMALVTIVFSFSLYYQHIARKQIEDITQQIESTSSPMCTVLVENRIPNIAKHYISCYDTFYAPYWVTSVWEWYYSKDIEYITEKK